jgi:hypothetical protein
MRYQSLLLIALTVVTALTALAGDEPPQYVFVLDLRPTVGMRYGNKVYLGQLGEQGTFYEVRTQEPYQHPSAPSSGINTARSRELMKRYPIINVSRNSDDPERVYEYRCGRLIAGEVDGGGPFIPEIGGKIIAFADYKYSETATRIYNLPGYFMRRDKLEERRRWLAEHLGENPEYANEKARLDAAVAGLNGKK